MSVEKVRFLLLFGVLPLFSIFPDVECFWKKISQITSSLGSLFGSTPEEEKPSLVLAVLKSTDTVIANVPIVTNRVFVPNFKKFLFACPAESDEDKKINESSSTKKALFIKYVYENPINKDKKKKGGDDKQDVSEFDKEDAQFMQYDCLTEVLPYVTLVDKRNENGVEVEYHLVGYEVYLAEGYRDLKVEKYGSKLGFAKNFVWFNLLIIRFDRKGGNVLSVTNEMYNDGTNVQPPKKNSGRADKKSQDLLWNNPFYPKYDIIVRAYTFKNQLSVFENLFGQDLSVVKQYLNEKKRKQLVEVHLTSLDDFVHPLLAEAAKTYGNIAPMWENIRINAWLRVEEYVKHLIQGVYGTLVVTGTYGTLSLSRYKLDKEVSFPSNPADKVDIYLGGTLSQYVRVPLAFWKIITYTKKADEYYHILIVTINNPYEQIPNLLCEESQCKQFGWDYVEVGPNDFTSGRTLCCELTAEILKELQLSDNIKLSETLNLKQVPHWENQKLTLDLTKFIDDRRNKPKEPFVRADDRKYRNDKNIKLPGDPEESKADQEGEGGGILGMVSTFVENYVPPFVLEPVSYYFSFLRAKKKEDGDATIKKL